MAKDCKVEVVPVEAEEFETGFTGLTGLAKSSNHVNLVNPVKNNPLKDIDGILVPGGFGSRGVEGKIAAIKYAREHKIPFLGICLGMQCTVIEYARDVLGWKDANSTEFDEHTTHPVIDLMEEQRGITQKGGHACSGKEHSPRSYMEPRKTLNTQKTKMRFRVFRG